MAGRRAWVLSGVVLLYSLLCFVILGARAIWEGRVSKRPGSKFWTEVEQGVPLLEKLSFPIVLSIN